MIQNRCVESVRIKRIEMSVYPGTSIPTGVGSSAKFSHYVDNLMTPRLMGFRMIHIDDEPCTIKPDRLTWKTVFGNWLVGSNIIIRKNELMLELDTEVTDISYVNGTFKCGIPDLDGQRVPRDTVFANYIFDYFPQPVLEGLLLAAVSIVNVTAVGTPTSYTIDTAPTNWEGIVSDVAFAMCMERLLLDYDLWRYRLVFAIGPNEVEGGGADIVSQITTLKQNAEERANKAMENPKFKTGNYLAPPTGFYFSSIRGFGGSSGAHGMPFSTGKLRGWRPNKMY
jgi:hypothetical protein